LSPCLSFSPFSKGGTEGLISNFFIIPRNPPLNQGDLNPAFRKHVIVRGSGNKFRLLRLTA
jgi:hypothetical protein